jgi:hypothetical protein
MRRLLRRPGRRIEEQGEGKKGKERKRIEELRKKNEKARKNKGK